MAKNVARSSDDSQREELVTLLQNNLIVHLAAAGVDNQAIARIVGVHVTRRVGPIASALRKAQKKAAKAAQRKKV